MDVESGPLSSWLCGELPPAIATEMDNSSFDDCISFRISEIGAKLDTLHSNFLQELSAHAERKGFDADGADPFRDFPANGKRPWAAEVGAESSVADIGVLAKETIFVQLPGTKTVEFCDAAGKAGPRPGRFEALFAVGFLTVCFVAVGCVGWLGGVGGVGGWGRASTYPFAGARRRV